MRGSGRARWRLANNKRQRSRSRRHVGSREVPGLRPDARRRDVRRARWCTGFARDAARLDGRGRDGYLPGRMPPMPIEAAASSATTGPDSTRHRRGRHHVTECPGSRGLGEMGHVRDASSGRILLSYGDVLTIDAAQGLTSTEHIQAMPGGTQAVTRYKTFIAASRHRVASYIVTSDGAERREIASRRPLGDPRPIRESQCAGQHGAQSGTSAADAGGTRSLGAVAPAAAQGSTRAAAPLATSRATGCRRASHAASCLATAPCRCACRRPGPTVGTSSARTGRRFGCVGPACAGGARGRAGNGADEAGAAPVRCATAWDGAAVAREAG